MKENSRQNVLIVLILIVVAVAAVAAKFIGDKVTHYQAYSTLQKVVTLSHPIHNSIEQLQKERSQASMFLLDRNPAALISLQQQFQQTDKYLDQFTHQLHITQILLLSVPEAELSKSRQRLVEHRKLVRSGQMEFNKNQEVYATVIDRLVYFLEKMYKFSDEVEFFPLISTLMNIEQYKEYISQEEAYVSFHLSTSQIAPGEFPLIKKMLADEIFIKERLVSVKDPQLKERLEQIEKSPEMSRLQELRRTFENQPPDLTGSLERGRTYLSATSNYLLHFKRLNQDILFGLDALADKGRENTKKEIIWIVVLAVAVISVITGIIVFIQRMKTT